MPRRRLYGSATSQSSGVGGMSVTRPKPLAANTLTPMYGGLNQPASKLPAYQKPAGPQPFTGDAQAPGGVGGPPVDPQFEAQKVAANTQIGLGNVYDTYQTGQINTQFGNLADPSADLATNPWSRAAQLQRSYENTKRGSLNSYAAQGQLYSGALQNKTEQDRLGYEGGLYGLTQQKQGALDQILKDKITRYGQVGASINKDELAALLRALGG